MYISPQKDKKKEKEREKRKEEKKRKPYLVDQILASQTCLSKWLC